MCDIEYPDNYEKLSEVIGEAIKRKLKVHIMGYGNHHIGKLPKADICISTKKLDRILEIREADLYAIVQSGMNSLKLQEELEKKNLLLPFVYDGSVGGLFARNYPSLYSIWFPYPKDFVLGAKILTGEGTVVKSGGVTPKFSSGYKIWKSLSGSLGLLGAYLEIIVRLIPKPEKIMYAEINDVDKVLNERPWGILFSADSGEIKKYAIFAGFQDYLRSVEKEYNISLVDGTPNHDLQCERIFGITTYRGGELDLIKSFGTGIGYFGSGYVKVCDDKALELRRSNISVVVEKGCKEDEDCFGIESEAYKILKNALDPYGIFV
ncbi:glycolate oxidase [Sulfolobus acidocaldarius SUSAZ]|nr:glycolate oxidase [Sulfolobus acidocaldarius SUSAZ]